MTLQDWWFYYSVVRNWKWGWSAWKLLCQQHASFRPRSSVAADSSARCWRRSRRWLTVSACLTESRKKIMMVNQNKIEYTFLCFSWFTGCITDPSQISVCLKSKAIRWRSVFDNKLRKVGSGKACDLRRVLLRTVSFVAIKSVNNWHFSLFFFPSFLIDHVKKTKRLKDRQWKWTN